MEEKITLDKKNLKILSELDFDARQSFSSIAKNVKVSKEVVRYRVENMIKNGLIEGFYTVIDLSRLGYSFYRIFIRLENVTKEKVKEITNFALEHPSIGWVVTQEGDWNFVVVVWAKNVNEFQDVLNDLNFKYSRYFQEQCFSIATEIIHFKHNYLYLDKSERKLITCTERKPVKIDKIDILILALIANNARLPAVDIANKINLSPRAVMYRLKNLSKKKIILGFRAKLNLNLINYQHFKIFLFLQNIDRKRYNELVSYLSYNSNVIYITRAIGNANLEFEIMVRTNASLHEIITEINYKFSDIIRNYKSVYMYKEHKINYMPIESK